MNTNPKNEIDELLMAAVDGVMTTRQQTELKRLLQHQPELAEELEVLKRQRKLLCSLPIETAPPSLVDEVKARLERKLILDGGVRTQSAPAAKTLARRFMAAAAMLLLPLLLLGYVVYRIVAPTLDAPPAQPIAKQVVTEEKKADLPAAVMASLPFDGVLVLTTPRPMLVAQSIEKQMFLRSMDLQMRPDRTTETIVFQIDCPADTLAEFVESLTPLWNQIAGCQLMLHDSTVTEGMITIDAARPEQIQMLARQTDTTEMLEAAKQYASANLLGQPGSIQPESQPEYLSIPQPILAWPQRPVHSQPEEQSHVRLMIEVRKSQ